MNTDRLHSGVPEEFPQVKVLLERCSETPHGRDNEFMRLVEKNAATPRHWMRLLRLIDLSLDAQVTGYATGVARFSARPDADAYLAFAQVKLDARRLMREAETALRYDGPPVTALDLTASACSMPWYYLWLGSTADRAASGLGLYVGLVSWHEFCVALVEEIDRLSIQLPEEYVFVFRRWQQRPTELLDQCLRMAEEGLSRSSSTDQTMVAVRLAADSMAQFLSACAV
ncbi:hypothetical protein ACPXCE_02445 [Streptomyces sp. DT24]|uniref:hypothetical protein n=1 Tax=unclassified Streptomyces TaxID=2593676 RepID=UPI0023B98A96|nr:hypothetical protein [Streptomyces sp. AM 4-1-1]WEH36862.1 hypothetical protein PZB75_28015 [Streptomyces sp. AM 4-1-1]